MKTKQVGGIKKKVVLGLWPRKWAEITKFREWENRIEKCVTYWIREISGTSWGCPWVHEVLTDSVSLDTGALWTRSWYIGWDLDDVECVRKSKEERKEQKLRLLWHTEFKDQGGKRGCERLSCGSLEDQVWYRWASHLLKRRLHR